MISFHQIKGDVTVLWTSHKGTALGSQEMPNCPFKIAPEILKTKGNIIYILFEMLELRKMACNIS